jgi:hypothetical protein
MAEAQTWNPKPLMRGSAWGHSGRAFSVPQVLVGGSAPPVAAASAKLRFSSAGQPALPPRLELPLTITNPLTWEMHLPEQVLPLAAGDWRFQLVVIRTDSLPKIYLQGTLRIL